VKRYLTDPRLLLFSVLIVGASIISAHGAWLFFGYLVDKWLAAVFTGVVAVGIIGLDAAGTLERGWRRVPYYSGMAFFIVLETLANYFAGQAGFVGRIQEALHEQQASDLLHIATTDPGTTRSLVVLFLSPASLAVALFAFAATKRVIQLRVGADAPLVARLVKLVGMLRQRRGLVRKLVAQLREARGQARAARGELAALAESSRLLAARVDRLVGRSRIVGQRRGLIVRLSRALREARGQLADVSNQLADTARLLVATEGQLVGKSQELAAARGEVRELTSRLVASDAALVAANQEREELYERLVGFVPSRAAIVIYVRDEVRDGRTLEAVARDLDIPASTLRGWLAATVEQSGYVKEGT